MFRFILLILVGVLAFYVGWPAYSGYQINTALKAKDTETLEAKIDFPSVRASMRAPIMAQVEQRMDAATKAIAEAGGPAGTIDRAKVETVVDGALADTVNAQKLAEIVSEGGDLTRAIQAAVLAQVQKAGGITALFRPASPSEPAPQTNGGGLIGGIMRNGEIQGAVSDLAGKFFKSQDIAKMLFPAPAGGDGSAANASEMGISNIKSVGFAGPLGLTMGVARDPASAQADVTAEMRFEDMDWRLKKMTPDFLTR
ncbi:MAG: DUF2939 domain-containing protein [Pseudomonadota bacterium]